MDQRDPRLAEPLGTFRAVDSRDAVARRRDGELFYAAQELAGSVPTWEVMFADGLWLLASPTDLDWSGVAPQFTLEGFSPTPAPRWTALRFGAPWNGWATPVVTREVLAAILEFSRRVTGEPHGWDGLTALISGPVEDDGAPQHFDRLEPLDDGSYDLGGLGWTWETTSPEGV